MKIIKRHLAILLLIVALLLICVFGAYLGKAVMNGKKQPVRIAVSTWPGWCHVFIAEEKGFFKKNNVDVQLVHYKEHLDASTAFLNGEVDGIFQTLTDAIIQNEEIESKVVYVSDYSFTGDVIVGRVDNLLDLKGKTVGVEGINTFSHIFVIKALESAGLQEHDVKFKNVDAHKVLEALEEGSIDAGHTWEPTKSAAIKKGYKVLASAGDIEGIITDLLVFRTEVIEERSEDIQAIVRSLVEAQEYRDANWVESIKSMAGAVAISYSDMESGLQGVHSLDLEGNINAMKKLDSIKSLYGSGKFISDFYLKRGQLSKIPDFDQIIEPKFVNQLNQERK